MSTNAVSARNAAPAPTDTPSAVQHIAPRLFALLDRSKVTLIDLREPDEVLVHGITGAINIPFDQISSRISSVPRDKPVIVICHIGRLSEQVAEILADRGYDAASLEGGFNAYQRYLRQHSPRQHAQLRDDAPHPRSVVVDAKGLKCPGPIVKVADTLRPLPAGTTLTVEATEEAFRSDIAVWCERTGNRLASLARRDEGVIVAVIVKATGHVPSASSPDAAGTRTAPAASNPQGGDVTHSKTFVVFSGDLDKTIAVFIMANGAAAMGRKVTIFFTFWGLNILRRPQRVKVRKPLIERMLGLMMPRGTGQLGLSRMNMGGAGAWMIRHVMKSKNVESLEELIRQAKDHGVRLVACQMSMDIMGIRREELVDGVELGGVSTFLGAGETSDMSLFV